ncbi:hypothetical protein TNCV_57631 [Trichonephila clavipes]|nr:hypothetical protein TNCV_57631 [Trichonephila clavipes]
MSRLKVLTTRPRHLRSVVNSPRVAISPTLINAHSIDVKNRGPHSTSRDNTRAIGEESRKFEPRSSDVDGISHVYPLFKLHVMST